jgi:hypothetical protein
MIAVFVLLSLMLVPAAASGQPQGMDLRQASGVPLPAADLPVGTVSVRVVRGSFDNNVAGVPVVFTVDGRTTTVETDENGRAQLSGLSPGASLSAAATVDGAALATQAVTIGDTGIRFVLVAATVGPPDGATPGGTGAVPGTVNFGPESRVVADFSGERLTIYYVLQVVNATSTPVDLGGPLIIELPDGALAAQKIEGSTEQVTINGPNITVRGPFQPGQTPVSVAFELPLNGDTAQLEQKLPVPLQRLTVFALQSGTLDLESQQFTSKQTTSEQGQPLVVGFVPSLPAGQTLSLAVTGLPHHPAWPRQTALALGGAILVLGIWAALVPGPRRRAA